MCATVFVLQVRKEQSCLFVHSCDNCDHDTQTHSEKWASLPDSLWDEELHPCCCRVTGSGPLPAQPPHGYTQQIESAAERGF